MAAILLACEQALAGYHPAYANLFIKKGAGADQNNPVSPLPLQDINLLAVNASARPTNVWTADLTITLLA